jgi:steroid 5-alpha reductase family enzyme
MPIPNFLPASGLVVLVMMTWLLVKVSGVALLERTMQAKPGYEDYMRRTNAFIPWFPKSDLS